MDGFHARVVRRLPVFEFIVFTELSDRAAQSRLQGACASQNPEAEYPKPDWIGSDDRLFGEAAGQSFRLTTGRGAGGRAPGPVILGYVIPESSNTTTVMVRVRNQHWWSLIWAAFGILALLLGFEEASNPQSVGMAAIGVCASLLGTFGWQTVEGNRVMRIFVEVLR